jgi:AcrR family transcriptional regulator
MIARADAIERPRRALHPSGPDLRRDRAALDLNARATILSAAAAVLQDEGPAALTVRRIAQAVNTSTKAIYTHFGGKDGLLDSVYLEGFAGFGRSMSTVPAGSSPPDRLRAMCAAYRGYGQTRPAFYNVMFGDMGRAYRAPVESRRKAAETFGILKEAIQASLNARADDDSPVNAGLVTRILWAAMHGVVSLELRGLLAGSDDVDRVFALAVDAVCAAHGVPIGTARPVS